MSCIGPNQAWSYGRSPPDISASVGLYGITFAENLVARVDQGNDHLVVAPVVRSAAHLAHLRSHRSDLSIEKLLLMVAIPARQ